MAVRLSVRSIGGLWLGGRFCLADCDAQHEKLTREEKAAGVDPKSKPLLAENQQPGMRAMLAIRQFVLDIDASTKFDFIDIPKPGISRTGGILRTRLMRVWMLRLCLP